MTDVKWTNVHEQQQQLDKNELRKRLPLQYLLMHYGIALEERNGKLVANCPVHLDENPSFDVYQSDDEDFERCGCWSCQIIWAADIYDVIQALDPGVSGLVAAIRRGTEILKEYESEDGWTSKPVERKHSCLATTRMCRSTL